MKQQTLTCRGSRPGRGAWYCAHCNSMYRMDRIDRAPTCADCGSTDALVAPDSRRVPRRFASLRLYAERRDWDRRANRMLLLLNSLELRR